MEKSNPPTNGRQPALEDLSPEHCVRPEDSLEEYWEGVLNRTKVHGQTGEREW